VSIPLLKHWRRPRLRRRGLPPAWRAIIERNVPYVRLLSPAEREQLEGDVQVFLAEKHFEGCGGLVMTDEIRVTIAAQACLLLLNRSTDYYPGLRAILVYPSGYVAHSASRQPDGTVIEGPQHRSGESWLRGAVVLSWDDVRRGAADPFDGRNLVLHEFAHQLDGESGANEGAPALGEPARYAAWARVLGREYEQLIADLERRMPTLIDGYGATAPAEFFAVVTEAFFERPRALRRRHPELYGQLRSFYRQDPAARLDRLTGGGGSGS
jgi:Mlc titration factor MtfA (ptsG expression regulator)